MLYSSVKAGPGYPMKLSYIRLCTEQILTSLVLMHACHLHLHTVRQASTRSAGLSGIRTTDLLFTSSALYS